MPNNDSAVPDMIRLAIDNTIKENIEEIFRYTQGN